MLGIKEIASYVPSKKISNYDRKEKFELDDAFIKSKLGVEECARKENDQKASDLCVKAFENLVKKVPIPQDVIDCVVVVTQNPDFNIPHTSAIVHGKLGLAFECACYDISLGCSGYVYGLSNILAFMQANNFKNGLLFTADPYSEILDEEDKNTALLFGDAASVTYISTEPNYILEDASFGTNGQDYQELLCNETLYMNGRAVFNFAATTVPKHITSILDKNNLTDKDINKYILHQGSKYIVDTIRKRLKVEEEKVPFDMYGYGNTVSSSIPIILEKEMITTPNDRFLLSGFGIGLSWATAILKKSI